MVSRSAVAFVLGGNSGNGVICGGNGDSGGKGGGSNPCDGGILVVGNCRGRDRGGSDHCGAYSSGFWSHSAVDCKLWSVVVTSGAIIIDPLNFDGVIGSLRQVIWNDPVITPVIVGFD